MLDYTLSRDPQAAPATDEGPVPVLDLATGEGGREGLPRVPGPDPDPGTGRGPGACGPLLFWRAI